MEHPSTSSRLGIVDSSLRMRQSFLGMPLKQSARTLSGASKDRPVRSRRVRGVPPSLAGSAHFDPSTPSFDSPKRGLPPPLRFGGQALRTLLRMTMLFWGSANHTLRIFAQDAALRFLGGWNESLANPAWHLCWGIRENPTIYTESIDPVFMPGKQRLFHRAHSPARGILRLRPDKERRDCAQDAAMF